MLGLVFLFWLSKSVTLPRRIQFIVNESLISIVQGACPVTLGLGGITEGQRLLVRRCRVGSWTILECLNCHLLTHATRGHGGTVVASILLIVSVQKRERIQGHTSKHVKPGIGFCHLVPWFRYDGSIARLCPANQCLAVLSSRPNYGTKWYIDCLAKFNIRLNEMH